jgi:hypothetical protein
MYHDKQLSLLVPGSRRADMPSHPVVPQAVVKCWQQMANSWRLCTSNNKKYIESTPYKSSQLRIIGFIMQDEQMACVHRRLNGRWQWTLNRLHIFVMFNTSVTLNRVSSFELESLSFQSQMSSIEMTVRRFSVAFVDLLCSRLTASDNLMDNENNRQCTLLLHALYSPADANKILFFSRYN